MPLGPATHRNWVGPHDVHVYVCYLVYFAEDGCESRARDPAPGIKIMVSGNSKGADMIGCVVEPPPSRS